jgi:hypothetical protein
LLRDTYKRISERGGKYIAKADYVIEMCGLIKACQNTAKTVEAPVRATRKTV